MGTCFGLYVIFCLLSPAGGGKGAGQGRGMLFTGKIPHEFFQGEEGSLGRGDPFAILHYSTASPPRAVGAVAWWTEAHAGMGVTGCTPSWTKDGGCHGVRTARGKPCEGGTSLLHRGWIWDCEVGDSPGAPLERCLLDMRV